jgi:hypothetical protein
MCGGLPERVLRHNQRRSRAGCSVRVLVQHHVRMTMYIARSEGSTFKVVEDLGDIDPKECEVRRA